MDNYGLPIMGADELIYLSESIPGLPERRLEPTWAYIQALKYNAMIEQGDCAQARHIFKNAELPLIQRLYPPGEVHAKVKKWISFLRKNTDTYSQKKFHEYRELRRYGIGIDEARKRIQPLIPQDVISTLKNKYSMPFTYQYNLECGDADLLFRIGIDSFIKLFYEKFYLPVNTKNYEQTKRPAVHGSN